MANISFWHESLNPQWLHIDTGINNASWSYGLNTAKFPTYGGEVIQILSVYIDDLTVEGDICSYKELEAIYKYFIEYMTIASQGDSGTGSYNQRFMKMYYHERNWEFVIQPLSAAEFIYSKDTVAPSWKVTAHIVDETAGNYQELKEMVVQQVLNNEDFKLQGIISPASADPENNPFAAPGTTGPEGEKIQSFAPYTQKKTESVLKEYADYYNTLLPSYLSGDYSSILNDASKPAFGRQQVTQAGYEQELKESEKEAKKLSSEQEAKING